MCASLCLVCETEWTRGLWVQKAGGNKGGRRLQTSFPPSTASLWLWVRLVPAQTSTAPVSESSKGTGEVCVWRGTDVTWTVLKQHHSDLSVYYDIYVSDIFQIKLLTLHCSILTFHLNCLGIRKLHFCFMLHLLYYRFCRIFIFIFESNKKFSNQHFMANIVAFTLYTVKVLLTNLTLK